MVIFQYNLYIFWIHLYTVLYPKPCYNKPGYKEVVVYLVQKMRSVTKIMMMLEHKYNNDIQLF